jgi:hypothetical protein
MWWPPVEDELEPALELDADVEPEVVVLDVPVEPSSSPQAVAARRLPSTKHKRGVRIGRPSYRVIPRGCL